MRRDYLGKPKYRECKNKKYEAFVRSKPCIICGKTPVDLHHVDHARSNASYTVPLCREHHGPGFRGSYHTEERARFEEIHNINLDWVCLNLHAEFLDNGK